MKGRTKPVNMRAHAIIRSLRQIAPIRCERLKAQGPSDAKEALGVGAT